MKNKKILVLWSVIALIFVNMLSTFATNIESTANVQNTTKKKFTTVIGKITSIDANKVTIEVATKKQNIKNDSNEKQNSKDEGERKKPNIEDRFVSTGTTKTYDISSTNFGRKVEGNINSANIDGKEIGVDMTYVDYKVGDYISITEDSKDATKAKRIRSAIRVTTRNVSGGYKGSFTGKSKKEKQSQ